jgi:hypothetical protein
MPSESSSGSGRWGAADLEECCELHSLLERPEWSECITVGVTEVAGQVYAQPQLALFDGGGRIVDGTRAAIERARGSSMNLRGFLAGRSERFREIEMHYDRRLGKGIPGGAAQSVNNTPTIFGEKQHITALQMTAGRTAQVLSASLPPCQELSHAQRYRPSDPPAWTQHEFTVSRSLLLSLQSTVSPASGESQSEMVIVKVVKDI